MSSLACLPNEPRLSNPSAQSQLTSDYLAPFEKEIEQLFLSLRRRLDEPLRQSKPIKLGKAYPLGQCLEISKAMWDTLKQVDESLLEPNEMLGYQALVKFINAGGELRQVWGDLRGQYFQNAFLLGSWYLDVANDTVDVNKPSVEILPFDKSGLTPIRDFFHFAAIAKTYWKAVILPNILVPSLSPYFPLIVLQANTGAQLHGLFDYMIALTQREAFQPSEEALTQLNFPDHWLDLLRQHSDFGQSLPNTVAQCRQASLAACRTARKQQLHNDNSARNAAVKQALQVNQAWQGIRVEFNE